VVERGTPGFETSKQKDKIALRVVQNAHITLDGVRVPEENRLQQANSFKDTAKVLRLTRAGVAWQATGCARGAYEHALAYARQRQQFGRPIGGFQLVQDLLVKMLSNVTASACLCARLSALQQADLAEDHRPGRICLTARARAARAVSHRVRRRRPGRSARCPRCRGSARPCRRGCASSGAWSSTPAVRSRSTGRSTAPAGARRPRRWRRRAG